MLANAPVAVENINDLVEPEIVQVQERFRFRMRPSVLAGLLMCAGVVGAVGFAGVVNYIPVASAFAVNTPVKVQDAHVIVAPQKVNANMQLSYELAAPVQVKKAEVQTPMNEKSVKGGADEKVKSDVQIALAGAK